MLVKSSGFIKNIIQILNKYVMNCSVLKRSSTEKNPDGRMFDMVK